LKPLLHLLRYSRGLVALAMLTGMISGAANAALLALVHSALESKGYSATVLVWSFGGLCLFMPLCRIVSQVVLGHLAQMAIFDMRMKLSEQILDVPLVKVEELGGSRILATLTDDIVGISNALTAIPALVLHISIVSVCLAYLGWLSMGVFLGVSVFVVLGMLSYSFASRAAMRSLARAREAQDWLFDHFRSMIEGAKELRLHRGRRTAFYFDVLRSAAKSSQRHNTKGLALYTAAGGWSQFLFFLLIGLVVFALPRVRSVDVATLTGYVIVLFYMLIPLEVISGALPNLGRANVALKKVESLGLSLGEARPAAKPLLIAGGAEPWESLELVGVTHSYKKENDDRRFQLGPVNLRIRRGELIFLIGGNGAGKTTLVKVIAGLYAPASGDVLLNGTPITEATLDAYRQLFSALFSDFYLFETLLGIESSDLDNHSLHYLKRLQLDKDVTVESGKLSTLALSQGQRKRLALLTAYLEDRPIYIFDEWAADQDPLFKNIYYHEILAELKARGKTILAISHDDRYFSLADRIIKIEEGNIEYDTIPNADAMAVYPVRT